MAHKSKRKSVLQNSPSDNEMKTNTVSRHSSPAVWDVQHPPDQWECEGKVILAIPVRITTASICGPEVPTWGVYLPVNMMNKVLSADMAVTVCFGWQPDWIWDQLRGEPQGTLVRAFLIKSIELRRPPLNVVAPPSRSPALRKVGQELLHLACLPSPLAGEHRHSCPCCCQSPASSDSNVD